MQNSLTLSLLVIFVGITLIPLIAKKFNTPVIVAELIFGILLGRSFFHIVEESSIIDFFASFGLVYLMFLAGLEIDFSGIRHQLKKTIIVTLSSLVIPFFAGFIISPLTGVHPLLLGTIFSTTSLGFILAIKKELHYKEEFLNVMFGSVVLVDIISIFFLAFSIAYIGGGAQTYFAYSALAILVLFLIPWILNRAQIKKRLSQWIEAEYRFELEVRFAFALIFILAAISDELGFHSIIGAFIAGLIISELTSKRSAIIGKLEGFGYGFFIPLFFIFMGAKVDLPGLLTSLDAISNLVIIVTAAILSNIVGVTLVSRIVGFTFRESVSLGFFHATLVSLTIAAAEIARRLDLVTDQTFSIFVLLAIISALVCPATGKYILRKSPGEQSII